MLKILLSPVVLLLAAAASFDATAQRYDDTGGRDGGSSSARYSSGPQYDYARVVRVVRVDPVIVSDGDGSGRCEERSDGDYVYNRDERDGAYYRQDEDRYRRDDDGGYGDDRYRNGGNDSSRQLATVIGGVAGALLGSQVGGGDGRYLGTAVGTLVGGVAGRAIYQANNRDSVYQRSNVRVCEPLAYGQERERVAGYDITYEYAGRIYQIRRDYNPGDRIRVRVDVSAD